ncbi:hypothetical protein [Nitrococcus mobilis]|uniref:DUF5621 domain-containing protein n=1 Tax=Nitrococcus mobilis Nb-231 TaxID=314278 RepID=A4BPC2_9GAMM|nr:hypothetical protein [Nitrococcus mobilis]EAR22423.1 hypothetical protein NB231_11824 [Nitrococcus mobilis Nb-231]
MAANIFTVFNHGTAFDRDSDPNELISELSRAVKGYEARIEQTAKPTRDCPLPYRLTSAHPTHLICEGPGSQAVSALESASGVAHDRPGVFNPLIDVEKNAGNSHKLNPALTAAGRRAYWIMGSKESSNFQDHFMGNTASSSKVGGLGLGRGWDDNVYKTAWLVQHLKWSEGVPIDTVNLIGWSRGAVTCLKTANKLFEVFEDTINVNIFAVDPVPGGLNAVTDDIRFIPPNVRNYAAILALDENGCLFEALDRSTVAFMAPRSQHGPGGNPDSLNPSHVKPHVHFLPFPGNHSDVVNSGLSSQAVANSPRLIRHLAWKFLRAHGTEFHSSFDLVPRTVCHLYEQLMTDLPAIAKHARTVWIGKHGLQREREVSSNRGNYVKEPETYLNEHHRMCALGTSYPGCLDLEDIFCTKDWADWNVHRIMDDWSEWRGGKTVSLPKEQTHLHKLGFGLE